MPFYRTSSKASEWMKRFLRSEEFKIIAEAGEGLRMNTKLILEYLRELEENNSREWFHGTRRNIRPQMENF